MRVEMGCVAQREHFNTMSTKDAVFRMSRRDKRIDAPAESLRGLYAETNLDEAWLGLLGGVAQQ